MKELADFEISEFGKPSTAGVYAVWIKCETFGPGKNHLLYIGSTSNLHTRLNRNNHPYRVAYNRFNGLVWVSFIETEDYRANEFYLIKKHRPILNKRINNGIA